MTRRPGVGVRSPTRVRRSLLELQAAYDAGTRRPLEQLWRAWIGMSARPPEDPQSFFALAGHHGAPGNHCNHRNVLFPMWHRAYLLKVEEALRSVPGCEEVALPFWDETDPDSLTAGIPWALTRLTVRLDDQEIPNPLRSFVLPTKVADPVVDGVDYSKAAGYETKRYPLSGLVATALDAANTAEHNSQFSDRDQNVAILNANVMAWLNSDVVVFGEDGRRRISGHVAQMYRRCLSAPNYTVFSNQAAEAQWKRGHPDPDSIITSLESPHNSIHLAVGGFELPGFDASPIDGANGDMGENDTAAYDPIFYFHHCFVDRVFWLWQQDKQATAKLDIIPGYAGTEANGSGAAPSNTRLDMDTPLEPFSIEGAGRFYTSRDCIDIENQLGYTYGAGSLQDGGRAATPRPNGVTSTAGRMVAVTEVDRSAIRGSFLISVFVNVGGERVHLGTEAVLSRWHVESCANCRQHLQVGAYFPVRAAPSNSAESASTAELEDPEIYEVEISTRSDRASNECEDAGGAARLPARTVSGPRYRLEIL